MKAEFNTFITVQKPTTSATEGLFLFLEVSLWHPRLEIAPDASMTNGFAGELTTGNASVVLEIYLERTELISSDAVFLLLFYFLGLIPDCS